MPIGHFLTNGACLWLFGILAEPVLGTKRFALTYLAFGVIGGLTLVAIIPHWTSPMVGASGAICGILGTFLALHFSPRMDQGRKHLLLLLLEAIALFAVGAWFVTRSIPLKPDRPSSVAWHLIPFLLAWYSVGTRKGLSSIGRIRHADRSRE